MEGLKEKVEVRDWVVVENQGEKIFGVLHRPLTEKKVPVVGVLHGFASSKQGSNRSFVLLAEALAKAGIATLRFDFRGSGDSEGDFSFITIEDMVSDAIAVYQYLESREDIDAQRMGLFGSSLGGGIGVMVAERYRQLKALALWSPVASGEMWFRDWMKKNGSLGKKSPDEALANYQGVAICQEFRNQFAKMYAHRLLEKIPHIPLLHFHGAQDTTLSLDHQKAFQKYASASSHFVTFPETDHYLGHASIFPEVVEKSIAWFQNYL